VSPKIIIELVELIQGEITITQACARLGVPRATYYRWKAKNETKLLDGMVEMIRELCIRAVLGLRNGNQRDSQYT
jgi:putative transposase